MNLVPIAAEDAAPLTACPALPDVPPVVLVQTHSVKQAAAAAEKEREEAWHFQPAWHGRPLHPHSIGRDSLWRRLIAADLPAHENAAFTVRREIVEAVRLLYLLATPAEHAATRSIVEHLECAETWADDNIGRHENLAAIELVRRLRRLAFIVRARIRIDGGRGEAGAVPVFDAAYTGLLGAAFPSATLHEVEWEISLPRGWSLIHAHWVRKGHRCAWLDGAGSKTARWLAEWRRRRGL